MRREKKQGERQEPGSLRLRSPNAPPRFAGESARRTGQALSSPRAAAHPDPVEPASHLTPRASCLLPPAAGPTTGERTEMLNHQRSLSGRGSQPRCERCDGPMFPDEGGDQFCLMCGERVYTWLSPFVDRLLDAMERQALRRGDMRRRPPVSLSEAKDPRRGPSPNPQSPIPNAVDASSGSTP